MPVHAVFAIGVLAAIADDPGDLELPRRLRRRDGDRRDRSLHRVRAAGLPALRLGDRFEHGAWSLGRHYKWIDIVSLVWVGFIAILFSLPLFKAGLPWDDGLLLVAHELHRLWFAAIGLFFGGWWMLLGEELVQGPGADGFREELEQMERQGFLLPPESPGRAAT